MSADSPERDDALFDGIALCEAFRRDDESTSLAVAVILRADGMVQVADTALALAKLLAEICDEQEIDPAEIMRLTLPCRCCSSLVGLAAPGESKNEREALARRGHALPDGSYPIPDKAHLHKAAVLAASGHGNVAAARAPIRKRAAELGVPLESLPGFGKGEDKKKPVAATQRGQRVAAEGGEPGGGAGPARRWWHVHDGGPDRRPGGLLREPGKRQHPERVRRARHRRGCPAALPVPGARHRVKQGPQPSRTPGARRKIARLLAEAAGMFEGDKPLVGANATYRPVTYVPAALGPSLGKRPQGT